MVERVLVVGASGNIGVSAVKGALRSGRQVLAIVRNQASADKLYKHVGSSEGIDVVEADVTSDTGVKSVVDQVKAGKLPAFQHVYTCVAYRDTIEYLLEQDHPDSTWTICTGAQGELAIFPLPAMGQGPLFPLVTAAARENDKTNVRVNEVFLMFRVEVDEDAAQHGVSSSSEFASVYEKILANPKIRGSRVRVAAPADIKDLKWTKKF
ncbi:nadp-binding [Trichoderma arundinaceum]|uniref:Nadp-binding n=1 Tax=Trichoderma arundinaceum TaxID=490622 RepID=A0A395NKK7_TRIAR|nr:nadp-binding [Trichoderma arundinaceum]